MSPSFLAARIPPVILGLAACAALLAALPALAQQGGSFREGTCSGMLCDYIGGAQAPAAQAQKSLFREGTCGGILCDAIGGSQAPQRSDPPPPCGGGLLCDLMPYKMGVPATAAEAARAQAEAERRPVVAPAAVAPTEKPRHRRRKAEQTAKAGDGAAPR